MQTTQCKQHSWLPHLLLSDSILHAGTYAFFSLSLSYHRLSRPLRARAPAFFKGACWNVHPRFLCACTVADAVCFLLSSIFCTRHCTCMCCTTGVALFYLTSTRWGYISTRWGYLPTQPESYLTNCHHSSIRNSLSANCIHHSRTSVFSVTNTKFR